MTLPPDPEVAQARASAPDVSAWVAASAGTGKTKVLTDRVLRLMLPDADGRPGTPPERILCITFTRAAAAEMANRLIDRLAGWATTGDAELAANLAALIRRRPTTGQQQAARRLLAQVLDAPGALNIQTIHAFCQSVLRRFPLEAGLSPHFEAADEQVAAALLGEVRDRVVAGRDPAVSGALRVLSGEIHEDRLDELLKGIVQQRTKLARAIADHGGLPALADAIRDCLGVAGVTEASLRAAGCRDAAFDGSALRAAAAALATGSAADAKRGQAIAAWLDAPDDRTEGLDDYRAIFLKTDGEPRTTLISPKCAGRCPDALDALQGEALRLAALADRCKAAANAEGTIALLTLGQALIDTYDAAKARRGLLDYDDLIDRTAALLEAPGVAPWVLFKLDGGIDHLLIDEAQDTNPEQWRIVAALAEEMHAGLGRGDGRRTLFVVGDEKQSIFSFQRADPREFARMRRHFQDRRTGAEGALTTVALNTSFRSGRAVLKAVDAVFARDVARRGVTADAAEEIRHIAHRRDDPGCVEIWPPIGPSPSDEEDAWTPPVTQRLEQDPGGRLAGLLAATIRGWIDDGLWLPSRKAPMEAGDVLVLVRTRNRFFNQLVRALKERRVPVAGLDRMVLRDQLAVKDLLAVAQVLLLPDDDLTLAAVLKSPFVGFDDDAVFALAHGRTGTLWRALGAGETAPARSAAQWLAGLMAAVDYLAPFELLTRLLTHPCPADPVSGRRALLTRLGAEAEDPVDELLTLACALEASGPATLERFVHLASTSDVQVKREFDQDGPGRLRIMTVHGAKGLQAPIVILPDTVSRPKGSTGLVWPPDGDGVPLWAPRRDREDGITTALRQRADLRQEEEYRRLLYVAMTRAEDRLVVAGFHGNARVGDDCWYRLCSDALEAHPDIERVAHAGFADPVLRLSFGDITRRAPPAAADTPLREPLPPWARTVPAPEPEPPHPLTPSRPEGEEPAAMPPFQAGDAGRFRRGLVVHALLQALPELPESRREAAARRYLANPAHGLAAAEQAQVLAETLAVMADPAFAPVFGPGSRAEVPVAAVIAGKAVSGQIDRLVARPDAVLIVDYKTNRPPPPTPAEVPALYWRQMAAYRAAVGRLYGDRPVRCALLWTAGPRLMVLDGPGLDAHARDAGLV